MNIKEEKLNKKIKYQKYIIIFLILLIPIIIFLFMKNSPKIAKKYTFLDPWREFIPAENYITNLEGLRNYLRDLEDKYPDSISIYYENINSGANISVNKELRLFPASLSKLVQAIIVMKKVEQGILPLDQKIKIFTTDISSDSGNLYQKVNENSALSVEELLKELLLNSDNTAQNTFKRYLTFEDYVNFQNSVGLQDLYNEKGFISAKEYTRILRVLYTSNFLKPENSEKILEYMSKSIFKDYLSQGIPIDVVFAHKYGENKVHNIFADSGIVYVPGKPYMISVIIKGKDSTLATRSWAANLMKEISIQAYNASK